MYKITPTNLGIAISAKDPNFVQRAVSSPVAMKKAQDHAKMALSVHTAQASIADGTVKEIADLVSQYGVLSRSAHAIGNQKASNAALDAQAKAKAALVQAHTARIGNRAAAEQSGKIVRQLETMQTAISNGDEWLARDAFAATRRMVSTLAGIPINHESMSMSSGFFEKYGRPLAGLGDVDPNFVGPPAPDAPADSGFSWGGVWDTIKSAGGKVADFFESHPDIVKAGVQAATAGHPEAQALMNTAPPQWNAQSVSAMYRALLGVDLAIVPGDPAWNGGDHRRINELIFWANARGPATAATLGALISNPGGYDARVAPQYRRASGGSQWGAPSAGLSMPVMIGLGAAALLAVVLLLPKQA